MQDLSALLGGAQSRANHINESGQIVGAFNLSPSGCGQSRAFLYSGGTMRDLGTLAGTSCSEAIAINDFGEVVGYAAAADRSAARLFYYNGNGLQDLGTLGPYLGGRPWAINNAGQIVGAFSVTEQTTFAFLYSDGVLTNLNSLVPANLGWELRTASGINDSGQIVCVGYLPGSLSNSHAFLLTPTVPLLVTEPNSNKAIALDSVTLVRDPFPVVTTNNFSQDQRTRILLFARDVVLAPGETASVLTVQAEDAQHGIHSLPVEFVGAVPQFGTPTQIVVRLPDELSAGGDFQVSIALRGVTSNKGVVSIKPGGTP
jgi:probable HAF family extracellular repeat protein